MSSKPLAYESLKCVLQYMDPNKRFQIPIHCPSTRTAERSTPLKIDKLEFSKGELKVNDTTYQLTIHQKYYNGREQSRASVEKYEVDGYGFKDTIDEMTLQPGDVKFGKENEDVLDHLENRIRRTEHENQMRRNELPPPNEGFFRFSVTSRSKRHFEDYHHNNKYSTAMRQLGTLLFGGRRCVTCVRELQIVESVIIRLPKDLKFRIGKLCFPGDVSSNLAALSSIIHQSSYPLNHLYVNELSSNDARNEIVNAAKLLEITPNFKFSVLPGLLKLTNQRVHVAPESFFSAIIVLRLLVEWRASPRPIGAHYTIRYYRYGPSTLSNLTNMIRRKIDGVIERNGCVFVPVNESVEIEVHYTNELHDIENVTMQKFVRIMVVAAN